VAFDNTSAHIVLTPSGGFLAGNAGGIDVSVQLFEFEGELTSHCDLVAAPLIATGTATFRSAFAFTPGGAIAGTIVARGTVDLVSGGQALLVVRDHTTIRPDGTPTRVETTITLTPL
jgi:hypothetical protein